MAGAARWGRPFVVVAAIAAAMACATPSPSREVADRFMELYYTRMSVAEAVKLSAGAARTKLEGELQAIQGVPPDAPADKPRVTFDLTASSNPTPSQATYTYRVTAHTSDVSTLVAALTVTKDGEEWRVTSFSEIKGPPSS